MREYLSILLSLLVAVVIGVVVGLNIPRKSQISPVFEKVDTLYIRDTITQIKPVSVTKKVIDSVLVPVVDTLRVRDTLFIAMERESVRWEDSLSIVYASGIRPQIDSVAHFVTDRIITVETVRTEKAKTRWGVGLVAGYGANHEGLSPFFGVGVSYNLLSW